MGRIQKDYFLINRSSCFIIKKAFFNKHLAQLLIKLGLLFICSCSQNTSTDIGSRFPSKLSGTVIVLAGT